MISSKELMERAGLSRATLNNYIALGLLPRPELRSADPSGARVLGYFPDEALARVEKVRMLKASGWTMSRIASEIADAASSDAKTENFVSTDAHSTLHGESAASSTTKLESPAVDAGQSLEPEIRRESRLQLSLDDVTHPAYMFSYRFELTWFNEAARQSILGDFSRLPSKSDDRHVLPMLTSAAEKRGRKAVEALLRAHLQLVSGRLSKDSVLNTMRGTSVAMQNQVASTIDDLQGSTPQQLTKDVAAAVIPLAAGVADPMPAQLIATYFREGVLVVCVPEDTVQETVLQFLSRRELMISQLLRNRLPVLTPVAILAASLEGSTQISSELPPEEYFELINEIWTAMDPIFRAHGATHGKHVGDGMAYFFFPQPDSHYAFNALRCACEMGAEMRKISNRWALRKGWFNELHLNTGLHEGTEWLGTFQTATSIEFAVLGDTINQAARLSEFARHGSVWASKGLIGKLSSEERSRLHYGVTRKNQEGREVFVSSTFAQIATLMDGRTSDKVSDVAQMPVTEVRSVS